MYDYAEFIEAFNARTPHTFSIVNTGGGCMCMVAEAVSEAQSHVFDMYIGGYDGPLPLRADLGEHGGFGVELVERGRGDGANGYYTETRCIVATGITVDGLVDAVNAHPTSMPPIEAHRMSQPTEGPYTITFTTSVTLTYTMFGDELAEVMGGIPDDLAAALDKGGVVDASVDVAALVDFLKRDGYGHFEQAVRVTQVHPS